jgi:Methylenetetrahydrofolate reductase
VARGTAGLARLLATVPRVNLQRGIGAGSGEFLLFAVTPPRLTTSSEEAAEIGRVTLERLRGLPIDGLVLYDIDDESDRNPDERPFPFLPTMDPADYLVRDLAALDVPAIVYRAVGKYPEDRFRSWLEEQDPSRALAVFVGSSSREKEVLTSLARAYELREEVQPGLPLGGVAIAERHARTRDEHLRLIAKQAAGCSFFITQIVYDVNAAKDLISDYHHECAARDLAPVPIVLSFSVCGSLKTLEFLRWLGVTVPRWIENELRHADDTLDASYEQAVATAVDLIAFCRRLRVPFGLNVESVSIRKVEIEASVRLAARLGAELRR